MDLDGLDYDDMKYILKMLIRSRDKEYYTMLDLLIRVKPKFLPLHAFMKKTV